MHTHAESSGPLLAAISDPPFKVQDCLTGQDSITEVV